MQSSECKLLLKFQPENEMQRPCNNHMHVFRPIVCLTCDILLISRLSEKYYILSKSPKISDDIVRASGTNRSSRIHIITQRENDVVISVVSSSTVLLLYNLPRILHLFQDYVQNIFAHCFEHFCLNWYNLQCAVIVTF